MCTTAPNMSSSPPQRHEQRQQQERERLADEVGVGVGRGVEHARDAKRHLLADELPARLHREKTGSVASAPMLSPISTSVATMGSSEIMSGSKGSCGPTGSVG